MRTADKAREGRTGAATAALAVFCACCLPPAAAAGIKTPVAAQTLVPSYIDTRAPQLDRLTAELRGKAQTLGLNGLPGLNGETISRALLLLPRDRTRAGVLSFEIEGGTRAGVWQCEALGRGLTSPGPRPGWPRGLIGGATVYYAPPDFKDGATVPGVYDLRNIAPDKYEIALLGKPGAAEPDVAERTADPDGKAKPFFSAVWRHWYSATAAAVPVDMVWATGYQKGSQGWGRPVFEWRSAPAGPEERARQEAQLSHEPRYYYGPYGRSGWAVHTDRWEDAERRADPQYAGRPELSDFRWRDTNGCVKVRPACLAVLNAFIGEQAGLGRRVQLEVRETELLEGVPGGPPK